MILYISEKNGKRYNIFAYDREGNWVLENFPFDGFQKVIITKEKENMIKEEKLKKI